MLEQDGADPLGYATPHLAFDDRRVEGHTAVFDDQVAVEPDQPGLDVYLDDAAVGAARPAVVTPVEGASHGKVAVNFGGHAVWFLGENPGEFGERQGHRRRPFDADDACGEVEVGGAGLEQLGGDVEHLVP